MLPHRGAARVLGPSMRPSMVPGVGALYARRSPSPSTSRPALALGPASRRTFASIVGPLGEALMTVHASTGLPWYLLLPAFTALQTAVVEIPLFLQLNRTRQRRALMEPLMAAWRIKTRRAGLVDHAARAKVEMKRIRVETKTQYWRTWVPLIGITLPNWIINLETIRQIANSEGTPLDPSFATEGCLWFFNLAAPDPLYILPGVAAISWGYRLLPKSVEELHRLFQEGDMTLHKRAQRSMTLCVPVLAWAFMDSTSGVLLSMIVMIWCRQLYRRIAGTYVPYNVPPPDKYWYFENWKR